MTIPPLSTNDIYEMTLLGKGTNRSYEYKLNGKAFKMGHSYVNQIKLTTDGRWQIDREFRLLNPVGIDSYGHATIINGELDDYFFRVYSDYEIIELETAKRNLLISKVSLWVIIAVGMATIAVGITTILLAKKQGEIFKELTEELKGVTEELREVARGIRVLTGKQIDQEHEDPNSKKKKKN